MVNVKTRYVTVEEFKQAMRLKGTRWLMFHQLATNLSVEFPPSMRDDLIQEAVIKCIRRYSHWDKTKNPFSYFTSVARNRMMDVFRNNRVWQKYNRPLPIDHENDRDQETDSET